MTMKTPIYSSLFLCLLALLFQACQGNSNLADKEVSAIDNFDQLIEKVRLEYEMPALAAAVISSKEIKAIGVTGIRRLGDRSKVKLDDRFHLGSTTKAITAHWAASLVEAGFITWETTILEVFPHWEDDALRTYHKVTLADLLCHRGKIQPFTKAMDLASIPRFSATDPMAKRRAFAKWLLEQNPAKPGNAEGYEYSNAGYSIAAAMLEKVSETAWEEAIVNDVLAPMNIEGTIGWPTDYAPDQPYGHHSPNPLEKSLRPVTARNMFQMEDVVAPSGDLSMSLPHYSNFVQQHLQGIRGTDNVLKSESYQFLHYGQENYAMGWVRLLQNNVQVSSHDGSAGTFYSHTSLYKEKDLAIVILVNASNIYATKAVYSLKKRLLELYAE